MDNPEDTVMPFGKHSGKTLGDILAEDPGYLDWLRDAEIRSNRLRQAVDEMCEKYAAEIERAVGD
jgi:uncharacterized protein (DUF3820 family)